MKYYLFFPTAIIVLLSFITSACGLNPWVTEDEYPDVVSITKTTKFSKAADGVSPMRSRVGTVIFSHKIHEEEGLKCVECHHKNANPDRIKQCAVCHIGGNGYETMHGLCVDCHIEKKEGPQKCYECH